MNNDIIKLLEDLLVTLNKCRTIETDVKTLQLYNIHINSIDKVLNKLKTSGSDKVLLDEYFEQEGRAFGWSYLPNENGRIAEEAFWSLKKKLDYNNK